ncbi:MAG: roadblock/LC7 domain-containing protein [Anaerolineae bacterium]
MEGGAYFSADGVLITSAKFGSSEDVAEICVHWAAMTAIAHQFCEYVERGEFEALVLEAENGYIVLMPYLDKAILAVLARKQARIGVVLLDMHRAIDGLFGSGLAGELISPPRPPKRGTAHANPEPDET